MHLPLTAQCCGSIFLQIVSLNQLYPKVKCQFKQHYIYIFFPSNSMQWFFLQCFDTLLYYYGFDYFAQKWRYLRMSQVLSVKVGICQINFLIKTAECSLTEP